MEHLSTSSARGRNSYLASFPFSTTHLCFLILALNFLLVLAQDEYIATNPIKGEKESWPNIPIFPISKRDVSIGPDVEQDDHNDKRATCSYTQVQAGDGCFAVAGRCKITQEKLVEYNNPKLCSTPLQTGQYVCCSSGTLPDFSPKPNPDGSCKTTKVGVDFCAVVAAANHMTVNQIEERNKNTWGWAGCNALQPGQIYCLSTGTPPMPPPLSNAVCGPQVPGTAKPTNMGDLASLNQCPLKACCNVWGQCGTTKEFCIKSPADTGAPGTTKPGANSCIYNCGMDIVNNDKPPASFIKVGYFEGFNPQRPCLHMRPGQTPKTYTHVHYAFGGISDSYNVDIKGQEDMVKEFVALSGVKRIMSFGGWSFSTEGDTFAIFRKGVTAEQRDKFAQNVVKFLTDKNLDGLDFDWEYPGAPDIPGIPPGDRDDGSRYLAFLLLVRKYLPKGKSLSIAAPASYWYLKGFPIAGIGNVVDYIVYMTYDIHGQWDFNNSFSDPGCPTGGCLRSQVNLTETTNSLSMVTKAGVQANKIILGMPLYGRSFKMAQPGCRTPNCHFTGPKSGAKPGRCTGTPGYISNFEIREIISTKSGVQQYSDADGDYVIYDNDNWVSWLTKTTYDSRVKWIKGLNFGGTVDWAMDLDADYGSGDGPGGGDSGSGPVLIDPSIYTIPNPGIQCDPQCTFVFPPMTLPAPTTISILPETLTYEENWSTTITISGALITTSAAVITSTVITLPPVTTTVISIWDVTWTGSTIAGSSYGTIDLTMSVPVPAKTFTYKNTHATTTTGALPIIWTYSPAPWPPIPPKSIPPGATTTHIPPPPPPPSGFPASVTVHPGAPGPLCKKNCGKPCRHNCDKGGGHCLLICGCIGPFCPHFPSCAICPPGVGCIGPGCSDGGGGGGDGDPNDPSSSCRTSTTVSSCEVDCSVIEYPATTKTKCQDPACSWTFTACSTSGTTTTTTTTLSCPLQAAYPSFRPGDAVPRIGDGLYGGIIVDPGEFTSVKPTTTPPSTTTSTPPDTGPPIPTFTPGGGNPYCFRDHNANGQYRKFGERVGDPAIDQVCNTGDVLPPSNTFGFAVRAADGLLVSVTWAQDQTGCPPKQNVPLKQWCIDTFRVTILTCDKGIEDDTYGGAWVEQNSKYGCVRWWIGTSDPKVSTARSFAVNGTSDGLAVTDLQQQQQSIKMMLDEAESHLPKMIRLGDKE